MFVIDFFLLSPLFHFKYSTTIYVPKSILCFAFFCGTLIMFNYLLNIFLVFPAICLYDKWLMNGSRNVLVNFGCCSEPITTKRNDDNEVGAKRSHIHTILNHYYILLHKVRYGVLVGCIIATIVCIYIGLKVSA